MFFLKKLYSYLYFHSWRLGLWTPPDRKILKNQILKDLADNSSIQTILFVGVRDYCQKYKDLFKHKHYWTIDPDQYVARFGADNHIVDSLENLRRHLPDNYKFDAIIMNGVIGYGINDQLTAEKSLVACLEKLTQQGLLIVGINPENTGQVHYEDLQALNSLQLLDQVNVRFYFYKDLSHSFYFYKFSQSIF